MKQLLEQKMKEMLEIMQAGLTKQEFIESFKRVIDFVKSTENNLKEKLDNQLRSIYVEINEKIQKIEEDNNTNLPNLKRWVIEQLGKTFIKKKVDEKFLALDEMLEKFNAYTPPNPTDIAIEASKMASEGLLPLIPIMDKVEEKLPEMGGTIATILENLPEGEKLKIEAIEKLREELDELRKMIHRKTMPVMGGGGVGKHNVEVYDLSASLNGVLKTFSLPSFWKIVDVKLSSVPVLRLTTDYTISGNTLTFTSEIDVATALAAGQSCIVIYSE